MLTGKAYLVVIGIDNYTDVPKLNNAVRDAKAIRDVLVSQYQFEPEDVLELFDEAATRESVEAAMRNLIKTVGPSDSVVIYFAGHGAFDEDFDLGYWVTSEAVAGKPSTYLSNNDLLQFIRQIKSRHIFLISDSCFSGQIFFTARGYVDRVEHYPSRWALSSGRKELVSDGAKGGHSPFAEAILSILGSPDLSAIPVSELCQRVKAAVAANTDHTPQGNPLSNIGDQGGEFVFRLKGIAPQTTEVSGNKKPGGAAFQDSAAGLGVVVPKISTRKTLAYGLLLGVIWAGGWLLWMHNYPIPDAQCSDYEPSDCWFFPAAHCDDYVWRGGFFPSGKYAYSVGLLRGDLKVWNYEGRPVMHFAQSASGSAAAVSPDGQFYAVQQTDTTIGIYHALPFERGGSIGPDSFRIFTELKGHSSGIVDVAYSADGSLFASGSDDNTAILWSVTDSAYHRLFRVVGDDDVMEGKGVHEVALSPMNEYLAVGTWEGVLKIFDVDGNLKFSKLISPGNYIDHVEFSPDGRMVCAAGWKAGIHLFSTDGEHIRDIAEDFGDVTCFAFAPDGTRLLIGRFNGNVAIYDVLGNHHRTIRAHSDAVRTVSWSPDGKLLLSGGHDGKVKYWRAE